MFSDENHRKGLEGVLQLLRYYSAQHPWKSLKQSAGNIRSRESNVDSDFFVEQRPTLHPHRSSCRLGICPWCLHVLCGRLHPLWSLTESTGGSKGHWCHCYKPSGPYITEVRIVTVFLAGSQTHFQVVLVSIRIVPLHWSCS